MSLIAPLRRQLPRALQRAPLLTSIRASRTLQSHYQPFSTSTAKMSFSNTDTGSKPADPYTTKNLEQPDTLKEKVGDLITFVDKSKYCMMTTRIASSGLLVSRCMALAAKEGNGIDLIFHANSESGKTDDLESDNDINLAFLQPSGEWASISGIASIETDREKVRKYYSPGLKAWLGDLGDGKHDGGPEDPRIILIKVKAKTAQYAITRSATGALGNFVEFAKGVATGETAQVNKLRYLDESELQQWRTSSQ
ncbi:protein bli-3 [Aureobasidium pullulans]|uniref:Protein bli-3 n=1 Tax=Aureobasidium pullulans TaxID=5580 RepID=A0A4S9WTN6_AURPU|nr:protein bli-3 [Aureobasidium pullulans]